MVCVASSKAELCSMSRSSECAPLVEIPSLAPRYQLSQGGRKRHKMMYIVQTLGARLRGRTAIQRSKKGSEKVLGSVLGKGSGEGFSEGY